MVRYEFAIMSASQGGKILLLFHSSGTVLNFNIHSREIGRKLWRMSENLWGSTSSTKVIHKHFYIGNFVLYIKWFPIFKV